MNSAETFWQVYQNFVKAGFTEEQAWELFLTLVRNTSFTNFKA